MAGHSCLQYLYCASSLLRSIFRWSVPVFNIQDMCKAQGRGAPWCNLLKTRATCLFTSEIPAGRPRLPDAYLIPGPADFKELPHFGLNAESRQVCLGLIVSPATGPFKGTWTFYLWIIHVNVYCKFLCCTC